MRLILKIIWSQEQAQQVIVEPHQTLVFGQDKSADILLNHELVKFSIQCNESYCQLKQLDGSEPALLNYHSFYSVRLKDHDRIQAGKTIIKVTIENQQSLRQSALNYFQKQTRPLYAIVDTAQDKTLYTLLKEHAGTRHQCLFEGEYGKQVATAAPYLVQFDLVGDLLLEQLIMQGWGKNWSVYFNVNGGFVTAYNQIRQCLRVKDQQNNYMLFRFYDPRIFNQFIPSFDQEQLQSFFKNIHNYWIEHEKLENLMHYKVNKQQLKQQSVSLSKIEKQTKL